MNVGGVAGEEDGARAVVGGGAVVQPEVGHPHRLVQPHGAAGVGSGEGLNLVQDERCIRSRAIGGWPHGQQPPGGGRAEREKEQHPGLGEEDVRRAGFNTVGLGIGKDEGLRIGAALEPDPGQAAYAAVPTVAADHVAGGHDLLAAVAVAQRGRGGVRGVAQADKFNAAFHGDAGRGQVLAEDPFGLGL